LHRTNPLRVQRADGVRVALRANAGHDIETAAGQVFGDGLTDAAGGTGDEY
jgi:hypothetical protein